MIYHYVHIVKQITKTLLALAVKLYGGQYYTVYTTLAWALKGAVRCLTRILPGQYHGKAVCQ